MIRRDANTRAIQRAHVFDTTGRGGQDPVQRQDWARHRKAGFCGADQGLPKQSRRHRQTAPWAPFVQITDQQVLTNGAAPQVLANDPHLRDPQRLTKGQMRADHTKGLPVAGRIDNDGAPVAMAGQIQKADILDMDIRGEEHDHTKKAVAVRPPARCGRSVHMAQPALFLDASDIQKTAMWAAFFIRFLQHKNGSRRRQHFGQKNIGRPVRVDAPILTATAMDIPTDTVQRAGRG